MDKEMVTRLAQGLRREVEEITLRAWVLTEGGVYVTDDVNNEYDGYQKLDMVINSVFFAGWPTREPDPDKFMFAEVPLNHSLLAPLHDHILTIMWSNIVHLPEIVCRWAAEVLDGEQFKVRFTTTTDEALAAALIEENDAVCLPKERDLGRWRLPSGCLEVWNKNGSLPVLMGERHLGALFEPEILQRLDRQVQRKVGV